MKLISTGPSVALGLTVLSAMSFRVCCFASTLTVSPSVPCFCDADTFVMVGCFFVVGL